jgi:polar amino acid transport system permease protein
MASLSDYLPYIARGLLVTLQVSGLGLLVGVIVAFALGIGRDDGGWLIRTACGFVVELSRGTSAVVQLFLAFYVLPEFGIALSPMFAAVLVLGINEGSYASEIVRGAVRGVPRGQREASLILGMSWLTRYRRVILPQALPRMIPGFGNIAIDVVKFSSLVALVTVPDLTFRAMAVRSNIGQSAQIFALILVAYFAVSLLLSALFHWIERLLDQDGRDRRSARKVRASLTAGSTR